MERTLPLTFETLREVLKTVVDIAVANCFDETMVSHTELSVEEAFVNIMKYSGLKETDTIQFNAYPIQNGIRIILKDAGIPFNPLNHPTPNLENPSEDQLGSYGIYVMRHYMTHIEYARDKNQNVLVLTKLLQI